MENEQQYKSKNLVESKLKQNKQLNLVAALLFSWSTYPYEELRVLKCLDDWHEFVLRMTDEIPLGSHSNDCMGRNMVHTCNRCLIEFYVEQAEKLLKQ